MGGVKVCMILIYVSPNIVKHSCHYFVQLPLLSGEGEEVKPVDVVLAGLNTILPLMTAETLKVSHPPQPFTLFS